MIRRRVLEAFAGAGILCLLLSGCSGTAAAGTDDLPTFTSMDQLVSAVDEHLSCDTDPAGDPVTPMNGDALPTDQVLCLPHVQIDLYGDQAALDKALDLWSDTQQGPVPLVHGGNWMVVDLTGVATGEPSAVDLEGLASEMDAEYETVAT